MSDEIYYTLAKVLDTLPNGFPATESGVEIKILSGAEGFDDCVRKICLR